MTTPSVQPKFRTNQKVSTPMGDGIVEAAYGSGQWLVRLPINEKTTKALKQSSCLTPRATITGLWIFEEGKLT